MTDEKDKKEALTDKEKSEQGAGEEKKDEPDKKDEPETVEQKMAKFEERLAKYEEGQGNVNERLQKIEALIEEAEKELDKGEKSEGTVAAPEESEMKGEMAKHGKTMEAILEEVKGMRGELVAVKAQFGMAKTIPSSRTPEKNQIREDAKENLERYIRS